MKTWHVIGGLAAAGIAYLWYTQRARAIAFYLKRFPGATVGQAQNWFDTEGAPALSGSAPQFRWWLP